MLSSARNATPVVAAACFEQTWITMFALEAFLVGSSYQLLLFATPRMFIVAKAN